MEINLLETEDIQELENKVEEVGAAVSDLSCDLENMYAEIISHLKRLTENINE
jgi:CII-binding regulator of phage lambda lysogenization HflD